MRQEELIESFFNGDILLIGKKCGALSISTDYDKDNMILMSYQVKIAEKDLELEEITLWGWSNYMTITTSAHYSKVRRFLYDNKIGYTVDNTHPEAL